MEEINVKQMLKLNHMLSLKHYDVKFIKENDYEVYIVPINKEYDPSRNDKMFEIIIDYYRNLGFDAMIDETLMRFCLYKK